MATNEIILPLLGISGNILLGLGFYFKSVNVNRLKNESYRLKYQNDKLEEENYQHRAYLGQLRKRVSKIAPENFHVQERVYLMKQIPESWENL